MNFEAFSNVIFFNWENRLKLLDSETFFEKAIQEQFKKVSWKIRMIFPCKIPELSLFSETIFACINEHTKNSCEFN